MSSTGASDVVMVVKMNVTCRERELVVVYRFPLIRQSRPLVTGSAIEAVKL